MRDSLAVGLTGSETHLVTDEMSPPHLPNKVLSTPDMIKLIEGTCLQGVQTHLDDGETTVGIHVCVSHSAAVASGESVDVAYELTEIDRKRLVFTTTITSGDMTVSEGRTSGSSSADEGGAVSSNGPIHRPPTSDLTGRVAIVTGAGASGDGIGNGRAAAILLAEAGATVLAVDRKAALAARTVELIEADGGRAAVIEADVTDDDQCRAIVADAIERWQRLDILVNNVGIGSRGDVVTESLESWDRVMQVNVTSMMLMGRHAIPAMIDGGGGAIVNISSISALRPRGLTAYSTSKGAVIALTRAMAADHGRDGVRVNCVAPGPVRTPMVGGDAMDPELADTRRRASVLGIEGSGWDIGAAVRFLASDEARYITGQTLVVDGGVTIRGPDRQTARDSDDG